MPIEFVPVDAHAGGSYPALVPLQAIVQSGPDSLIVEHLVGCGCGCAHNLSDDDGFASADGAGLALGPSASSSVGPQTSYTVEEAAAHLSRQDLTWSNDQQGMPGFSFGSASNSVGNGAEVTYGFLGTGDLADSGGYTPVRLSDAEIAAVEYALDVIASVADVTFVRAGGPGSLYLDDPSDADIDIQGWADTTAGRWQGAYSGDHFTEATVSIGERGLEDIGSSAFRTALHEISHALGLSHPGDYNGGRPTYEVDADYAEDSAQYTVMSYFDERVTGADFGSVHATGLMLHDIAALQRLYGANDDARSSDTVYGFGSNTGDDGWTFEDANDLAAGAIWDTGGRDRLDASGYGADQSIDLNEGAFSSLGGLSQNIAIAVGASIEDAAGGVGNDEVFGNGLDNVLAGGAGDDVIFGGAGDDVIFGGAGPSDWGI